VLMRDSLSLWRDSDGDDLLQGERIKIHPNCRVEVDSDK